MKAWAGLHKKVKRKSQASRSNTFQHADPEQDKNKNKTPTKNATSFTKGKKFTRSYKTKLQPEKGSE